VFSIFGRHDLLVRVWLDPEAAKKFPGWLQGISPGAVNAYPFVVTEPMFRWTAPSEGPLGSQTQSKEVIRFLNRINNRQTIQSLETGRNQPLFNELLARKLIYEHPFEDGSQRIQFFIAITPEDPASIQPEMLANAIRELAEREPAIERFTLDFGFGFCALLCKGVVKVSDYFRITAFLRGIARLVPGWGITTETLLANEEQMVAGSECIGESTFSYIEGKDLTALQTIPEIYSPEFRGLPVVRRKEILEILQGRDLSDEEQDFIHDYLLGVLRNEPKERSKSLAGFFIDLEYFLRGNYREFSGRVAKSDVRKVTEQANIVDNKNLTLGDLLNIYSAAMKISGNSRFKPLVGGWESLVKVRNEVVHGAQSFLDDWKSPLSIILDHLEKIRELKNCVNEELKLI